MHQRSGFARRGQSDLPARFDDEGTVRLRGVSTLWRLRRHIIAFPAPVLRLLPGSGFVLIEDPVARRKSAQQKVRLRGRLRFYGQNLFWLASLEQSYCLSGAGEGLVVVARLHGKRIGCIMGPDMANRCNGVGHFARGINKFPYSGSAMGASDATQTDF